MKVDAGHYCQMTSTSEDGSRRSGRKRRQTYYVAQVLSMIAESDESGSDMELSDLEIGGSESEEDENSAVVLLLLLLLLLLLPIVVQGSVQRRIVAHWRSGQEE